MNIQSKIKNSIINGLFLILLIIILLLPYFVFAAESEILNRLNTVSATGGYDTTNKATPLAQVAGIVIGALISLLGVIFIAYIVLAGYSWMTAYGDQTKVTKAKDTIKHSVIGLIIMLSAFAIWRFIYDTLLK